MLQESPTLWPSYPQAIPWELVDYGSSTLAKGEALSTIEYHWVPVNLFLICFLDFHPLVWTSMQFDVPNFGSPQPQKWHQKNVCLSLHAEKSWLYQLWAPAATTPVANLSESIHKINPLTFCHNMLLFLLAISRVKLHWYSKARQTLVGFQSILTKQPSTWPEIGRDLTNADAVRIFNGFQIMFKKSSSCHAVISTWGLQCRRTTGLIPLNIEALCWLTRSTHEQSHGRCPLRRAEREWPRKMPPQQQQQQPQTVDPEKSRTTRKKYEQIFTINVFQIYPM